jgi:phospholipid/cholesterol/gamma-HCH transport system permease protein
MVQSRARFTFSLMALAAGILVEALSPRAWRRSVRMEFRRVLRLSLIGSLPSTVFVGALVGFGMVYQAIYWLQLAGQQNLLGTVLVSVVLREVAPILVGVILLGRSGSAMLAELGQLQAGGQIRALQAQGIDTFQFLALPPGVAFALAAYTLGIIFVLVTLLVGFMMSSLLGIVQTSFWSFLDNVLGAASPTDFVIFPIKMLAIGLLVAATVCLTAFWADPHDEIGYLAARGFIRGMLAIMLTSGLLSLAA